MQMKIVIFVALAIMSICTRAQAVSPSAVGWFNTFVPGGGELLLGHYKYGLLQATIETSAFVSGFNISAKFPMTLDGVPEQIPEPHSGSFSGSTAKQCQRKNIHGVCINSSGGTGVPSVGIVHQSNINSSLTADLLQEIGIKYHMVNVFDSYRRAGAKGQVDHSSISDLMLAPFDLKNFSDPLVDAALLISLGFHTYSYLNETRTPIAPLDGGSNTGYGLMYGVVYPVGSAAPEEMFYRGFLQNEALNLSGSAYVAIPFSTLAYTFSHSSSSYFDAAVSGGFLGYLAYKKQGNLRANIAFHFWSDVIMGVHAILSLQRNQRPHASDLQTASVNLVKLKFEF